MKQIQKRYLYSGVCASLFFIITYGLLDLNIFIAIFLTIIFYLGGIFLFKTKDIRKMDPKIIDEYYFLASKVANRANMLSDIEIKSAIEKITIYTDEILVSLTQRPKKVEQVFDFFDYYLDITYKILVKYNLLTKLPNLTKKDEYFLSKTKDYIFTIREAFRKQLDNMNEARMLDIESEIRMFEKTIGIKKSDMEVGE